MALDDLDGMTIADMVGAMERGEVSAGELTASHIERIESGAQFTGTLQAVLWFLGETRHD